jgi:hypothetical protein
MTPEETPITAEAGATKSDASANPANKSGKEKTGGRQCNIRGFRHEMTGQFYALSKEDRAAMAQHCEGIVADFDPQNHRERWLATAIAED